jgi:uncharacterized membrane protein
MLLAVICAGVFTGAAIYINAVEHPARMEGGTTLALTEWAPSYRRATLMQAPLAVVGGLTGFASWVSSGALGWLVGAILLLSVVPFTLLVIKPTNSALLAPDAKNDLGRAAALLTRWNRLHAVRSVLSSVAFVLFSWMLLHRR